MSAFKNWGATLGGYFFEGVASLLSPLPIKPRRHLSQALGRLYGALPHHQKKTLKTNLSLLLKLSQSDLKQTQSHVFQNYVMTLHDFFFPETVSVHVPDRSKLELLRRQFGGVMVVTFHMGYWEHGARLFTQWGWPVTAVYQPYQNKKFHDVIQKRRAPGVNFIPVGRKAAQGVGEALRRGDLVAMVGDHAFGEEGVWVDLLGHQIRWPKGPIVLAVKEKAPIVVAVMVRESPGNYVMKMEEPLFAEDRSSTTIRHLTQEVAHKFAKVLKQYPTQWYRFRPLEVGGAVITPDVKKAA